MMDRSKSRRRATAGFLTIASLGLGAGVATSVEAANTGYVYWGHSCTMKVSGFSHYGNAAASNRDGQLCRTLYAHVWYDGTSKGGSSTGNYVRVASPNDASWTSAAGSHSLSSLGYLYCC